jgi:hypothetical protein
VFSAWSVPRSYKRTKEGRLSQLLSEVERVQLKKSSFELLVENWVEFWRCQSIVIKKKWQERN